MTLKDLHEMLDWSLWLEARGRDIPKEGDFLHNYQNVLLLGAIYGTGADKNGNMLPFPEDEKAEKAAEARQMLGDVWSQAVEVLKKEKMVT